MSELDDLYLQILHSPDDEALRGAFADAAERAGQIERSRFIRLQLQAFYEMRRPRSMWHVPSLAADRLLESHRDEWAGLIRDRVAWFAFHRGFVEQVKIDARLYLDTADELYRLAPIRKLCVTGLQPVLESFLASPYLQQIVCLNLEFQHIGDEGMELIAASPHLRKLVALELCANEITMSGVETLASSTNVPSLRYADFGGNPAKIVNEIVSSDVLSPDVIFVQGSVEAERIDAKYGRKTWLHPIEDGSFRIPLPNSEC